VLLKGLIFGLCMLLLSGPCFGSANEIQIQADQFELDVKDELVIASGQVRVEKGDIYLTSQKIRYDKGLSLIKFMGDVVIRKGDVEISCGEATAYTQMDRIQANTQVQFKYRDIHGEAGDATYLVSKQTVQFLGEPRFYQGEDFIKADEVKVDLKSNKVLTVGRSRLRVNLDHFLPKN